MSITSIINIMKVTQGNIFCRVVWSFRIVLRYGRLIMIQKIIDYSILIKLTKWFTEKSGFDNHE